MKIFLRLLHLYLACLENFRPVLIFFHNQPTFIWVLPVGFIETVLSSLVQIILTDETSCYFERLFPNFADLVENFNFGFSFRLYSLGHYFTLLPYLFDIGFYDPVLLDDPVVEGSGPFEPDCRPYCLIDCLDNNSYQLLNIVRIDKQCLCLLVLLDFGSHCSYMFHD